MHFAQSLGFNSSASTTVGSVDDAKKDVLIALSQIIDPDFGTDIVSCGFVKDLEISEALEEVKGNPFHQIIGI